MRKLSFRLKQVLLRVWHNVLPTGLMTEFQISGTLDVLGSTDKTEFQIGSGRSTQSSLPGNSNG